MQAYGIDPVLSKINNQMKEYKKSDAFFKVAYATSECLAYLVEFSEWKWVPNIARKRLDCPKPILEL